jgi:hypothetical protein
MADEMLKEVLQGSQKEILRYSREMEAEKSETNRKIEKLQSHLVFVEKRILELNGIMALTGSYADQRGIQLSLFDEKAEGSTTVTTVVFEKKLAA